MTATDKLRDIIETLVLHSAGSGPERIAHVIAMIGSFRVQSLKVIDEIEVGMDEVRKSNAIMIHMIDRYEDALRKCAEVLQFCNPDSKE